MPDLVSIFDELKVLLQKYETKPGLLARASAIDSKTKITKPAYHVYSMPLYSHQREIVLTNPDLIKMRKGKSCINIHKLNAPILRDLEKLIKEGITAYKKEGWI